METEKTLQLKIRALSNMLSKDPGFCVLTGAGCSTASGLPAYRNAKGDWQHDRPMEHQDFTGSDFKRKFYWARSQRGWPAFSQARPNQTHIKLFSLQQTGHLGPIITQNVDRLHQRAGSRAVVDLHGRLDKVVCLDCKNPSSRQRFQQRLESANINHRHRLGLTRPDGDVDLSEQSLSNYIIPACELCQGVLKPGVVFFGGVLDPEVAANALSVIDKAPGLIVVGSSLMVYSGFRLVKRAAEQSKPIVIINQGTTRADDLYTLKIEHESGQVLTDVCNAIDSNDAYSP